MYKQTIKKTCIYKEKDEGFDYDVFASNEFVPCVANGLHTLFCVFEVVWRLWINKGMISEVPTPVLDSINFSLEKTDPSTSFNTESFKLVQYDHIQLHIQ